MASKRRLNFPGNHQTTYSDWAKSVVQSYPNPRFQADPENVQNINVYLGDKVVGAFDFSTGTGWVEAYEVPQPQQYDDMPQFAEFDIDTMVRA